MPETYRIRLLREALNDLRDATKYYAIRSPNIGSAFYDEVRSALDKIQLTPLLPPLIDSVHRSWLLKRFPYKVIYRIDQLDRIDQLEIVILAVAHTSRRPNYWHN
jgi:plasmid stabilization system protein ParE